MHEINQDKNNNKPGKACEITKHLLNDRIFVLQCMLFCACTLNHLKNILLKLGRRAPNWTKHSMFMISGAYLYTTFQNFFVEVKVVVHFGVDIKDVGQIR